jgi:hypothetical protein
MTRLSSRGIQMIDEKHFITLGAIEVNNYIYNEGFLSECLTPAQIARG